MLRKSSIVLVLIAVLTVSSYAQHWELDKAHSNIGFSVKHLVISKIKGKFDDYSGHVMFDGKNPENGSVEITIQMTSVNTDNQKRDNHLKSSDFFEADKYPTMTFKSKKITKTGDNKYEIAGDLTIKDVTKEVTLDTEFNGALTGPMGKTRAGFAAYTKINRQDFHVAWENKLQDGSLIVGNDVEINLDIELVQGDKMAHK